MLTRTKTDIAAIVFAHDESNYINACIKSVLLSRANAVSQGKIVELILVLRRPTDDTRRWVDHFIEDDWNVVECNDTDLGSAKNRASSLTNADYVAIIDGSDMVCASWLNEATDAAIDRPAVWRPSTLICFGDDHFSLRGYSVSFQPTEIVDKAALLNFHHYPSGFLAPRSILSAVPWPEEDYRRGWGLVDWWWNCNVSGAGFDLMTRPGTFHYRRSSLRPNVDKSLRIGPTALIRCSI